jgi:hypothetical protein
VPQLRDYLAEERTFLAWIRTGISLMGFGFVVARIGIFGDLTNLSQQLPAGLSPSSRFGLEPRLSRSARSWTCFQHSVLCTWLGN